ncbi:MAG: HEAT repeat domain-containing protein [Actinomycetota bacterium]
MEENAQVTTSSEALDALFKSFNAAIKRSLVYSPSHPMCAECRAELFSLVKDYLATNEMLKFGITRDSIIIEGTEYDMAAGSFYLALAAHLHDRQLTSVTIYKPVTNEEMDGFLDSMAMDINELRKAGGIEDVLGAKHIQNIVAKKLEVEAAEELDELQFDDSDEEIVAAEEIFMMLSGESISDNEREKIILRVKQGPVETAKLLVKLSDMAATTEGDPSLEGRSTYLAEAIEKLAGVAVEEGEEAKQDVFQNICQGLTSLSDDFRSPILDILQERFGSLDFGPEMMEALNLALKMAGEQTVAYTEGGETVAFAEEGVEPVRLDPEEVYYEFAHFYDDMPAQVQQSVEEEIAAIEIEDVELQAVETLVEILIDSEDEPRLTKTLNSLASTVNDLMLEGRLGLAAKSIKAMLAKGQTLQKTSPELVNLPRDTLLTIADADNLTIILKAALESVDADEKRYGRAMLDMLGAGAVPGLLVLTSREPVGEHRIRLSKITAHAGRDALGIFERRLEADETIVRAVVLSMSQIDDTKATEILKKALRNESETVRADAVKAIASSRGIGVAPFISVMLDDVSEQVRSAAFMEIGKLKADAALTKLAAIAEGKDKVNKRIEFRVKAVQTMGEIGSPQSVPVLKKMAGKRFVFGRKTKTLKEEARQALQKILAQQEV